MDNKSKLRNMVEKEEKRSEEQNTAKSVMYWLRKDLALLDDTSTHITLTELRKFVAIHTDVMITLIDQINFAFKRLSGTVEVMNPATIDDIDIGGFYS